MNTSQTTSFLSEIEAGETIPLGKRVYFRERLRNRLYNFIMSKFLDAERHKGLTRAELARRLDRRPEVITRMLSSPGNLTIDTISDVLLGIAGEELEPHAVCIADRPKANSIGAEWHQPERNAEYKKSFYEVRSFSFDNQNKARKHEKTGQYTICLATR